LRDSILVPLINCGTSFYAGFVIFSVLGFMAGEKGVSVDDVAESGPGLVFIVYPEGLTQMPAPPVWAILFFFMLITLGFSSLFSMVECFFSSVTDEFPSVLRRSRATNIAFRAISIIIFYAITIPMVTEGGFYLFNLVDVFIGGFPLLFVGLFESVLISYVYGFNRFSEDIGLMLGKKPNLFFRLTWCIVSPGLLFIIIIFTAVQYEPLEIFGRPYPQSSLALGWCVVAAPLICIPIWFIYQVLVDGGWQIIKKASQPQSDWGPANPEDRTGIYSIRDKELAEMDSKKPSTISLSASFTNLPMVSNGNVMYGSKRNSLQQLVVPSTVATGFPGQPTITSSTMIEAADYAEVDYDAKRKAPPMYSEEEKSPAKLVITDYEDVESNNSSQVKITAQINSSSSSSEASAPTSTAGQHNPAFQHDDGVRTQETTTNF